MLNLWPGLGVPTQPPAGPGPSGPDSTAPLGSPGWPSRGRSWPGRVSDCSASSPRQAGWSLGLAPNGASSSVWRLSTCSPPVRCRGASHRARNPHPHARGPGGWLRPRTSSAVGPPQPQGPGSPAEPLHRTDVLGEPWSRLCPPGPERLDSWRCPAAPVEGVEAGGGQAPSS